jgi:indole-3-glycerol phosphate synthase
MNSQPLDVLARICATTRTETDRRRAETPQAAIEKRAASAPRPRSFYGALCAAVGAGYGLIAEIKRASPSGGLIRPEFDPAALAQAYRDGGATCLSVLTDTPFFQGEPAHLKAARAAVDLPVLRKDFILDPWQVYESRAMGADCILLILAALTDAEALDLEEHARGMNMGVLAEVHDRAELDRALGLQTKMIGVNNRNLKTLHTDLRTTLELSQAVPPDRFLLSESGIRNHEDVSRLAEVGVRAFLVGESLLRQPDVTEATRALLGRAGA